MLLSIFMLINLPTWVIAFVLLLALVVFYLLGGRMGNYRQKHNPEAKSDGIGPLEGALLGLFALLLSFTFSMSASRYDERRSLVITETNIIATTILRADMYPDSLRLAFRNDLQQYVEARIAYFNAGDDEKKIAGAIAQGNGISGRIWKRAADFSRGSSATIPHSLMIPSVNDMIDIVTTREASRLARVPASIIWLLIVLALSGSFIIGYSKKEKKHDWIVFSIYVLMTVITIYTIIDLDLSRRGFIKTTKENHKLLDLRDSFPR